MARSDILVHERLIVMLSVGAMFGCASSAQWAVLPTPYGSFAVDTAHTKVLADGMVETWVKEVHSTSGFDYWLMPHDAVFPPPSEGQLKLEVDCVNTLYRPKRGRFYADRRRLKASATYKRHNWSTLTDTLTKESWYGDRVDFLYRQACAASVAAAFVHVDNQSGLAAAISLFYRGRQVRIGEIEARSSAVLPFNRPADDFQLLAETASRYPGEGGRASGPISCALSEQLYANVGDTLSFEVPPGLERQPRDARCPAGSGTKASVTRSKGVNDALEDSGDGRVHTTTSAWLLLEAGPDRTDDSSVRD